MEDAVITLSPGLFFMVADGAAWIEGEPGVVDGYDVTPAQAAFLLADLNRWILLSAEAAEAWFTSAIRRARAFTAATTLLAAE